MNYLIKTFHRRILSLLVTRPSWYCYARFVELFSPWKKNSTSKSSYQSKGMTQGVLSQNITTHFLDTLNKTSMSSLSSREKFQDRHPAYSADDHAEQVVKNYDFHLEHYHLTESELPLVSRIIDELKEPVASELGCPWSVVDVRAWRTEQSSMGHGAYAWHRDNFPKHIVKVLIYLTGASKSRGTTQVKLKDGLITETNGPEGTWLLMKINDLYHRGYPPESSNKERKLLQITLVPSTKFELEPVFLGYNAFYPKYPWIRPKGFIRKRSQSPNVLI